MAKAKKEGALEGLSKEEMAKKRATINSFSPKPKNSGSGQR